MTHVISASGCASRIAATAGNVWTMSPSELGLMTRMDLMSAAKFQALREQARQTGLDDLILSCRDVVLHPTLLDAVFVDVINAVSRAPIPVSRLADAPGVDKIFFRRLDHELIGLDPFDVIIADERAGDVGVPEETDRRVLVGETGPGIQRVENIVPSFRCIERGVDDGEVADRASEGQAAQPFLVGLAQLFAGPVDRHF